MKQIPSLNGIRAVAALLVVLTHVISLQLPGQYAVIAFFVLSGFLITSLLMQEQDRTGTVDLKAFYMKRALRLFPAFYAVWFVSLAIGAGLGEAIGSAFYFNDHRVALGLPSEKLFMTWSLAIEEQFYLVWPAVFLMCRSRRKLLKGLVLVSLGVQIARAIACISGGWLYASWASEFRCDALLLGCAIALASNLGYSLPAWLDRSGIAIGEVAIIFLLGLLPQYSRTMWGLTAGTYICGLLMIQAISKRWRILNNPLSIYLGRLSYSIYLWQGIAFIAAERWLPDRLRYLWPGSVALALIFAGLSYHMIESPFLRIKDRKSRKLKTEEYTLAGNGQDGVFGSPVCDPVAGQD